MFGNCFGVLFSGFFLQLNTSSTKVSEIFNLAFALSSFFSFFTGPLVEQYGWRSVTLVTSLVYSLGLALSTVATSASLFFVFCIMQAGELVLVLVLVPRCAVFYVRSLHGDAILKFRDVHQYPVNRNTCIFGFGITGISSTSV